MLRAFCSMLLAAFVAAAQLGREETLTVNVDLVNIYFTVCNHKGRLMPHLDRDKFAVFEDGQPQVITHFSRETDLPLTIVLLIDTSGSVRDKLRFEKESATKLLYTVLRRGRDRAALITFNHTFEVVQSYTDDLVALERSISHLIGGGGTRLYDALAFVMEGYVSGSDERKVIILVTDGEDESSKHSPQEVIDLAHRTNVSIYTVSMNGLGRKPSRSGQSDQMLDMLASETGAKAFFPAKLGNIAEPFQKIADDLRSQYTIAYRSTNSKRDGTFRSVRIAVTSPHYSVHSRSGYYAPTQSAAKQPLTD